MDYFIKTIAMQGFGYLLFAGSILIIFFLYRENKQLSNDKVDLANKRVEDLKESAKSYAIVSDATQKVAENTYTIVQNLQQLLNNIKQV